MPKDPYGQPIAAPPQRVAPAEGADFFQTGGEAPPPQTTSTFAPGTMVRDRYHIEQILGSGGMGVVHLVTDMLLKQPKALKLLHAGLGEAERGRLVEELRLQQQLSHEGVLRSYDLDLDPQTGRTFFTMEYVPGPSLEQLLASAHARGQLPPFTLPQTMSLLDALTDALGYAHDKGIVHRDLKPSNILIPSEEDLSTLKVLDFGIARQIGDNINHTGHVGTAIYMAPEQMRGGSAITPAADIYAVGVILYQMLTGELFYGRMPGPAEYLESRGIRGQLPDAIDEVLLTALEALPERRYQTMDALFDAMQEATEKSSPQSARNVYTPSGPRSRRARSRSRSSSKERPQGRPSSSRQSGPKRQPEAFWKVEPAHQTASQAGPAAVASQWVQERDESHRQAQTTQARATMAAWGFIAAAASSLSLALLAEVLGISVSNHYVNKLMGGWVVLSGFVAWGAAKAANAMLPTLRQHTSAQKAEWLAMGWIGGLLGAIIMPGLNPTGLLFGALAGALAPIYATKRQNKGKKVRWSLYGLIIATVFGLIAGSQWLGFAWFSCTISGLVLGRTLKLKD